MQKIKIFFKILAECFGGWGALMSGFLTLPSTIFGFWKKGYEGWFFIALAFICLWVLVIKTAWKNYQILYVQNPEKKQLLLDKMVDFIKSSKDNISKSKEFRSLTEDYMDLMEGTESIGAFVKFSNEIRTDEDLNWLCEEFKNSGYKDPFENLETWGGNLISSRRISVLRAARLSSIEILTESQMISFLSTDWKYSDEWKDNASRRVMDFLNSPTDKKQNEP